MIQKVALVAIGRLENQYAREWAEHHLAAGFQHIILYMITTERARSTLKRCLAI